MTNEIRIKPGSTFDYTVTDTSDDVTDFTGWTITCQIRKVTSPFALVSNVTVALVDGGFRLTVDEEDTADWPVERLAMDILLVSPLGDATHSDTISIVVERNVTVAA